MADDADPDRTLSKAAARQTLRRPTEALLRAVYPPGLDWEIAVGRHRLVIGRVSSEEGFPPLAHETVSRSHLAVDWDGGVRAHVGADLGSHNGTRINGNPVGTERHPLKDGSILQLGDVLLVYEAGRGVTAPPAPEVSRDAVPGEAAAIRMVRAAVARAAPDPSPVLLIGETGTGKEWIAREIHRLSGRRRGMLAINCSALSPQIIDSQLFGHVRGAFTGANNDHDGLFRAADGGTLFLDEIGELPLELQPKLLRVLQEGQVQPVGSTKTVSVDVRVIAATNRDLSSIIESGEFRRDLYARLALWEIRVPPLRKRRGDVLMWIDRLHQRWREQRPDRGDRPLRFLPDVAEMLLLHDWRDNLRGLDRLIHELASATGDGHSISRDELPPWLNRDLSVSGTSGGTPPPERNAQPAAQAAPAQQPRKPVPTREEFEAVFEQLDGNVRAMAKHFGRDRRQIYRWLEAYDLKERRDKRDADE
ncbi:MAG TPA: sigma 54-interacting transcriptional regulator [Kofleriaceae bacterium]|nr:sigma 54-interacting transcriptional regulator [Kofleriaceae bacterium]